MIFTNELIVELEKSFINSASITDSRGMPYTSNHGAGYGSINYGTMRL
jgi:hypothetical protein